MQELLERLELWLQQNKPDFSSQLQPGLSLDEIIEITTPLQFQLPNEVIELYRWHNGNLDLGDDLFLFYRFLPLQEAVEDTLRLREGRGGQGLYEGIDQDIEDRDLDLPDHSDWQYYWFSIFYQFKVRIFTVGSKHLLKRASIIYFEGEDSSLTLWFKSLKGFISSVLECYESGLYLLEDFSPSDTEEICAKYRDLE
jgi:cell wall assembly regulator SMI1